MLSALLLLAVSLAAPEEEGRLARLHALAAEGRVPAQPRWHPPLRTTGGALMDFEDPFASRTAAVHGRLRLLPMSVAEPERWAPVQERSLLWAGCVCNPASLPGRIDGAPLRLAKVPGSPELEFTWTSSCSPAADDYALYEGTLGSFTSHVAITCSTLGSKAITVPPGIGSRYYLIVPVTATEEGSYGTRSDGSERPPASALVCRKSQRISACP